MKPSIRKHKRRFYLFWLGIAVFSSLQTKGDVSDVYGVDPLHPSKESWLGRYLEETKAYSLQRSFEVEHNGPLGQPRLVVTVSKDSFPIFAKYFSGKSFLYLFHEANQRVLVAAFNGRRGSMARLDREFKFIASGAMLIPLYLNPKEAIGTNQFFNLADITDRKFDVALFPWLLKDSVGVPYMPQGNEKSLSDWFVRMPISKELDTTGIPAQYSVDTLEPQIQVPIREVWTSPYPHQSLRQMLGLKKFKLDRDLDTPGLIASSLLANVGPEHLPVVFRFVVNHQSPLEPNFNTWFDTEYNPNKPYVN